MEDPATFKLSIPTQDFDGEPLFEPDEDNATRWIQNLPVTNSTATAQLLRQGLDELNRRRIAPERRYALMEILRPNLDVVLANLGRRFLNQSLIMPEAPQRMSTQSDELLQMAATGYMIAAIEAIRHPETIRRTSPARLACEAIQRALLFTGRRILQTLQLHRPVEPNCWQTLHQLYALAEHQRLTDFHLPEPLSGGTTIRATYLQAALLGCCKANQLRQSELTSLYRGLRQWSEQLLFGQHDTGNALFIVDLDSDLPPFYSTRLKGTPGHWCRYLDASGLISHLDALRQQAEGQSIDFDKDTAVPLNLLDHLIAALGSMSMRNFKRSIADNTLWICVGLASTHYHVAGERSFARLMYGDDARLDTLRRSAELASFLTPAPSADVWEKANPNDYRGKHEHDTDLPIDLDAVTKARLLQEGDSDLPLKDRYPILNVQVADSSPGGYCLEWSADLPGDIKAGDVVGLKEGDERKDWVIAVIRWVSRLSNARTLVGVELLSPRALAYGASLQRKAGETEPTPVRALLLPEIKLVGQPQTLITPRAGFKERQKVTVGNSAGSFSVQLLRHVSSTGSFSQFEFQRVKELGDLLAENGPGQAGLEFDSLWNRI